MAQFWIQMRMKMGTDSRSELLTMGYIIAATGAIFLALAINNYMYFPQPPLPTTSPLPEPPDCNSNDTDCQRENERLTYEWQIEYDRLRLEDEEAMDTYEETAGHSVGLLIFGATILAIGIWAVVQGRRKMRKGEDE